MLSLFWIKVADVVVVVRQSHLSSEILHKDNLVIIFREPGILCLIEVTARESVILVFFVRLNRSTCLYKLFSENLKITFCLPTTFRFNSVDIVCSSVTVLLFDENNTNILSSLLNQ